MDKGAGGRNENTRASRENRGVTKIYKLAIANNEKAVNDRFFYSNPKCWLFGRFGRLRLNSRNDRSDDRRSSSRAILFPLATRFETLFFRFLYNSIFQHTTVILCGRWSGGFW